MSTVSRESLAGCPLVERARLIVSAAVVGLAPADRAQVARAVLGGLAAAGFFAGSVEEHYTLQQCRQRVPRSLRYLAGEVRAGRVGRVLRDARGWLVPASSLNTWLARFEFSPAVARSKKKAAGNGLDEGENDFQKSASMTVRTRVQARPRLRAQSPAGRIAQARRDPERSLTW